MSPLLFWFEVFFFQFRYATRLDKFYMFIGFLGTVVTGACQPLNMLVFGNLTGHIIDYGYKLMAGPTPEEKQKLDEELISNITTFAIYNCSIGLAMLIFSYLTTLLYNFSGLRQIYKIRTLYLEKVLNQDISWYDVNQSGDFASRMTEWAFPNENITDFRNW